MNTFEIELDGPIKARVINPPTPPAEPQGKQKIFAVLRITTTTTGRFGFKSKHSVRVKYIDFEQMQADIRRNVSLAPCKKHQTVNVQLERLV